MMRKGVITPRIRLPAITGIVLFMAFLAVSPVALAAPVVGPIVPCGLSPGQGVPDSATKPCTICHLGIGVMNLTNFLIYYIALPSTALLVAAGGIMLLIAGPSEPMLATGKKILTSTAIGIIIVLTAWIIVDTLIKTITGSFDFAGGPGKLLPQLGPWNKITIPTEGCPL